jgi:hypothetical protein
MASLLYQPGGTLFTLLIPTFRGFVSWGLNNFSPDRYGKSADTGHGHYDADLGSTQAGSVEAESSGSHSA